DLGAATPDVHHQAPSLAGRGLGDAEVDETRLLLPGDDVDGVTDGDLRALDEAAAVARRAQRVGAHHAHALRIHPVDALAEALEAGQRPIHGVGLDVAVFAEAG